MSEVMYSRESPELAKRSLVAAQIVNLVSDGPEHITYERVAYDPGDDSVLTRAIFPDNGFQAFTDAQMYLTDPSARARDILNGTAR